MCVCPGTGALVALNIIFHLYFLSNMENRLPCLLAAVRLTVFLLSCLLNQELALTFTVTQTFFPSASGTPEFVLICLYVSAAVRLFATAVR